MITRRIRLLIPSTHDKLLVLIPPDLKTVLQFKSHLCNELLADRHLHANAVQLSVDKFVCVDQQSLEVLQNDDVVEMIVGDEKQTQRSTPSSSAKRRKRRKLLQQALASQNTVVDQNQYDNQNGIIHL